MCLITALCVQTCKLNFSSEQLGERAVIGTPRNTVHPNSVFYCRKPSFLRRKYLLTTSHGPSYILVPYVASTAAVPTRLGLRPRLLVAKLGITAVLAASAVVVVVVTAVAAAGCPARHRSRRWRWAKQTFGVRRRRRRRGRVVVQSHRRSKRSNHRIRGVDSPSKRASGHRPLHLASTRRRLPITLV